jgi:hypothetical protein
MMPMLFWYPMIVWAGMVGVALEQSMHTAHKPDGQAGRRKTHRRNESRLI